MKFGIWIEPEMANFDSDLLRAHPEYAAVDVASDPWLSRHQVMLDFANPEVVYAVYAQLEEVLGKYEIDYVKWDHNRTLEDYFSPSLDPAHQDEFYHRNTLGYYRLADMLTKRFRISISRDARAGEAGLTWVRCFIFRKYGPATKTTPSKGCLYSTAHRSRIRLA